jgi:ribosome-associated translation inhibitor RaiA
MRMMVRARNLDLTEAMRGHIKRRVLLALNRFSKRIRWVSIQVYSETGPWDGLHITCQVVASLVPAGAVVVESAEAVLGTAVLQAADRCGHILRRTMAHKREMRRGRWIERDYGVPGARI